MYLNIAETFSNRHTFTQSDVRRDTFDRSLTHTDIPHGSSSLVSTGAQLDWNWYPFWCFLCQMDQLKEQEEHYNILWRKVTIISHPSSYKPHDCSRWYHYYEINYFINIDTTVPQFNSNSNELFQTYVLFIL